VLSHEAWVQQPALELPEVAVLVVRLARNALVEARELLLRRQVPHADHARSVLSVLGALAHCVAAAAEGRAAKTRASRPRSPGVPRTHSSKSAMSMTTGSITTKSKTVVDDTSSSARRGHGVRA
jgi:hypothetical protein